jgi:hypothetical protein
LAQPAGGPGIREDRPWLPVPAGCALACTDPGARRLWVDWPAANIGIATGPSGLFVVDVDIRDGKPGEDSLEGLDLTWLKRDLVN